MPAGTQPTQAAPAIQEAQALALFGMGSALAKEGQTADAGKLFTELKTTYPWSPKVVEANFGIAKSLFQQNKFDDALEAAGRHRGKTGMRRRACGRTRFS